VMHIVLLSIICIIHVVVNSNICHSKDRRKTEVVWMGIALFLFAALRAPSVGIDVQRYFFSYAIDASWSYAEILTASTSYTQSREPVFHLFLRTLSFISDDPQLMLVVIGAMVAIGFSYFAYHQKGNILFIYLLFIGLRIFSFTLSGLRQATAMSLIFVAAILLLQNKTIRYVVFTCIAGLFHTSAFVFLLAYPIYKTKRTDLVLIACGLFVTISILSGNSIFVWITQLLGGQYLNYAIRALNSQYNVGSTFIIYLLLYVLSIFQYRRLRGNDENFEAEFRLISVGIAFSTIGQGFANMFRIAYYFIIYLFPHFSTILFRNIERRTKVIFAMAAALVLCVQYIVFGTGAGTENYVFFWQM
jgi:hypothetical protein